MNISADYLLAALRETLKEKGISYAQLSEYCAVPVSSLKRQFHNPSLGIDKITFYAGYLDTDLVQLSNLAAKLQQQDIKAISPQNNRIFAQYPHLYDFIYLLVSLQWSVEEIQDHYQLSDQSIIHYLRALEMMGYLETIEKTNIKLNAQKRFINEEDSPLDRLFVKRFKANQEKHPIRPAICMARINLTDEQITKLETQLYEQLTAFHLQNQRNSHACLKNVMLSFVPGEAIRLSDTLPEVDGRLLKAVCQLQQQECETPDTALSCN
ncbi:transcriptional regulator [Photobacterium sp. MCCC 1A19761]|uniref:transcriptional regulator n=1 Tax=Photobacterium sp. MCCC 1A19761 TaxID=3115000 RepID=UPI00307CD95E